MITVESKIKIYEIDSKDAEFDTHLRIVSHWNQESFVVIETPGVNRKAYAVSASDLQKAIKNATNTNRYA